MHAAPPAGFFALCAADPAWAVPWLLEEPPPVPPARATSRVAGAHRSWESSTFSGNSGIPPHARRDHAVCETQTYSRGKQTHSSGGNFPSFLARPDHALCRPPRQAWSCGTCLAESRYWCCCWNDGCRPQPDTHLRVPIISACGIRLCHRTVSAYGNSETFVTQPH